MSAKLRKIKEYRWNFRLVKVFRCAEYDEYIVKFYYMSSNLCSLMACPEGNYHTFDKEDAIATAKRMLHDFI